jgi:hypothetical protein
MLTSSDWDPDLPVYGFPADIGRCPPMCDDRPIRGTQRGNRCRIDAAACCSDPSLRRSYAATRDASLLQQIEDAHRSRSVSATR